jgi:UDP-hydrolysing UDP-N-acetyl-D-glucosamine 2-epimerase
VKAKRKIAFVTTARSDYNTMYPVMRLAQNDISIQSMNFCAGMHLVKRFGSTWQQLEQDGINITTKVDFQFGEDTDTGLGLSLAQGCKAFTEALSTHRPDIICVSGDRIENLSLFVAATAMRTPIAHMCGGDITEGAFDNQVRHTMTKLSHLHFVSMPEHARRVVQMGEEPWRITLTGDAAIDVILELEPLSREELFAATSLPADKEFCISTFHPQTLGSDNAVMQYETLLAELEKTSVIPVMIYPNIDPGFEPLIEMLEAFQAKRPDAIVRKSFDRRIFYTLMRHAKFMVGNSSSGLWEAPSFELPAINIGNRQAGRVRGKNVIDVSGLDQKSMQDAFAKVQSKDFRQSLSGMKNPFGDGNAAEKTLKVLKNIELDDRVMIKKFFDIEDRFFSDERLGI